MADGHRAVGIADELVVARLSVVIDLVVAGAAFVDVVALAAIEGVFAAGADEEIVAVGSFDIATGGIDDVDVAIRLAAAVDRSFRSEILDRIPFAFATEPEAVNVLQCVGAIGRMGDSYRAVGIADELVVARLAVIVDLVVVAFALIDVVALAAVEGVLALGADEAVRPVGARDIAAGRIDDIDVAVRLAAAVTRLAPVIGERADLVDRVGLVFPEEADFLDPGQALGLAGLVGEKHRDIADDLDGIVLRRA